MYLPADPSDPNSEFYDSGNIPDNLPQQVIERRIETSKFFLDKLKLSKEHTLDVLKHVEEGTIDEYLRREQAWIDSVSTRIDRYKLALLQRQLCSSN